MVKTAKEKVIHTPYVSADTFLMSARAMYQFSNIQAKAFKVRMRSKGKFYLPRIEDFVPYFEEYLGIEREEN